VFAHVTAENAGETLFIRSERQTLSKLPETGAIVFTIGVYVAPLGSLSHGNIARMAEAVATIPPEEAERRGAPHFAAALQAYAANLTSNRHPELVSGSISPHERPSEGRDGC